MSVQKKAVPYSEDSTRLFETIADKPWAMLLDSGPAHRRQGRYDILAADPFMIFVTRGERTEISDRTGTVLSTDDPFVLLREALQPMRGGDTELPFCGGALGYFGYDLGRRIERLPEIADNDEQLPEMAVGIYDWALVVDHEKRRSWLVSANRDPETRVQSQELVHQLSALKKP